MIGVKPIAIEDGERYEPRCDECYWTGPILKDDFTARMILRHHTNTRKHKTNIKSSHRFIV